MRKSRAFILAAVLLLSACGHHGGSTYIPLSGVTTEASLTAGGNTQFSIPTAASHPQSITVGSDGNLWFVETSGNKVGRITPSGVISEFRIPSVNSSPISITAGAPGYLWFTEYGANAIASITTSGVITEYHVPTAASQPFGIVRGPDGAIWFTELSGNKVGRFSAGTFHEYAIPFANSQPRQIIVGPDNTLWFAEGNSSYVGHITLTGSVTQVSAGGSSRFLTVAGDGAIWFTDAKGSRIGRITHFNRLQSFPVTAGSNPAFITQGPDGNAWFADFTTNQIRYVDATTHAVSFGTSAPAGSAPNGIVTGPDGNIWYTEYSANKIGVFRPNAETVHFTKVVPPNGESGGRIAVGPEGASYFRDNSNYAVRYLNGTFVTTKPYIECSASDNAYCPSSEDFGAPDIAVAPSGTVYWSSFTYEYPSCCGFDEHSAIEKGAFGGSATIFAGTIIDIGPSDMLVDPNGNVWAAGGSTGFEQSNQQPQIFAPKGSATYPVTDSFSALAWGPDATAWAIETQNNTTGKAAIVKLTSSAGIAASYAINSTDVEGLVEGPDGAFWFTDTTNNAIGRFMLGGTVSKFAVPTSNAGLGRITVGYDGALWFTESHANKIGRITTAGHVSEYALPSGDTYPYGIAVPPTGANCTLCPIWFTMSGAIGYITY